MIYLDMLDLEIDSHYFSLSVLGIYSHSLKKLFKNGTRYLFYLTIDEDVSEIGILWLEPRVIRRNAA